MVKVSKSFIFNSLDEKEIETVINAFVEKTFEAGQTVIQQREQGDVLYFIESGEFECYKVLVKGQSPTYLKNYYPGEAFGELALLYNAPRAASIIAKIHSILT